MKNKIKYKLYDKICFFNKFNLYIAEIYGINITEKGIVYNTRGINRKKMNKYNYQRKIHQENIIGLLDSNCSIEKFKDDLVKDCNKSFLIEALKNILEKNNIIKKEKL